MRSRSAALWIAGCWLLVVPQTEAQARTRWRVPQIARFLGVRVGANGYRALERRFGRGLTSTGGHPNSMHSWRTVSPRGIIETDGFSIHRTEGYAVESLLWRLDSSTTTGRLPVARVPAHGIGWLGDIYPGMRRSVVARLLRGRLPAPEKHGNRWTWHADGYVRPDVPQPVDALRSWTATLQFKRDRLQSIDVECE